MLKTEKNVSQDSRSASSEKGGPVRGDEADGGIRFVRVAGMKLVFDPVRARGDAAKKHPCLDCHFCQFCSDARCDSCRCGAAGRSVCGKLSISEQIRLYEQINSEVPPPEHSGGSSPGRASRGRRGSEGNETEQ